MRPAKAIREYCLWCCKGQAKEVRLCPDRECRLWPWRIGTKEFAPRGTLSSLRSIRAKCLACADGYKEVRACQFRECSLYPYRLGKNPARRGLGQIESLRAKNRP